jgi:hypothetical protein
MMGSKILGSGDSEGSSSFPIIREMIIEISSSTVCKKR